MNMFLLKNFHFSVNRALDLFSASTPPPPFPVFLFLHNSPLLAFTSSRVIYWQKWTSEFGVSIRVWIEFSIYCLPCWWLCSFIDSVKCLLNGSSSPSSPHILVLTLLPVYYLFSSSIFYILFSVEYMMDEMEKRSIMEEPIRKCPIPAPRTSVPSPSASPSLRHKSEYSYHRQNDLIW